MIEAICALEKIPIKYYGGIVKLCSCVDKRSYLLGPSDEHFIKFYYCNN